MPYHIAVMELEGWFYLPDHFFDRGFGAFRVNMAAVEPDRLF
jgi:hypothetical protein